MYGPTKFERQLGKLDDRMMVLSQLDAAIRLGRLQGELRQMRLQNYYRGSAPEPEKYERTPEYRLMKHYERRYHRLVKEYSR